MVLRSQANCVKDKRFEGFNYETIIYPPAFHPFIFLTLTGIASILDRPLSTLPSPTGYNTSEEEDDVNDKESLKSSSAEASTVAANKKHPGRPGRRCHNQKFGTFCKRFVGGRNAVERWAAAHLTASFASTKAPRLPALREGKCLLRWPMDNGREISSKGSADHREGRSRSPRKKTTN